jgi:hypothetical protein
VTRAQARSHALRHVGFAAKKAKAASEARDQAIVYSLEFATTREVAAAAGLSPARIHQIRHGK